MPKVKKKNAGSRPMPATPGVGGSLFKHPENLNSDARLCAHLISMGVVPPEQAQKLLEAGMMLAADAARNKDRRGYSACMRVAVAVAKLELEYRALEKEQKSDPTISQPVLNLVVVQTPGEVENFRQFIKRATTAQAGPVIEGEVVSK